jgi:hypothetical protein
MDAETEADEQMMKALSKLDVQAQEHFRAIVRMIALCYTDPELFSGLLITRREDETVMMSLNADEMEATNLINKASEYMTAYTMHGAPPKDKFN